MKNSTLPVLIVVFTPTVLMAIGVTLYLSIKRDNPAVVTRSSSENARQTTQQFRKSESKAGPSSRKEITPRPTIAERDPSSRKEITPRPTIAGRDTNGIVSAIEKKGGRVRTDDQLPGNPVVEVDFFGSRVRDNDLALLNDLPDLRIVKLSGAYITNAGLAHLKGNTRIQVLDISSRSINDDGLIYLKEMSNLRELRLGTAITDNGAKRLQELSALQKLDMRSTKIRDGLKHVSAMPGIRILSLSSYIRDADLIHLRNMSALRSIDLTSASIAGPGLLNLQGLEKIETIVLKEPLQELAQLKHSDKLTLELKEITDQGLVVVKEMSNLRGLIAEQSSSVTDKGFEQLNGLKCLRVLSLDRCRTSPSGMKTLKQMTSLESLRLRDVSDEVLKHIEGLTSLRILLLSGAEISNEGLLSLKGMTNLQKLELSFTNIDDKGLSHLEHFGELQVLDLRGSPVTAQGVTSLQTKLPKTKVWFN